MPIAAAESLPTAALAVPTEVTSTGSASRLQFADVAAAIASLPVNDGASAGSATDQPAEAKPAQPKPAAPKAETKPAPAKTAQAKKPEPTAAKAAPGKKADPAASKQAEGKKGEAAASKQAQAKKAEPAAKEPSRIWIQLAAAQNKAAFPGEFKRFKAKAPKLLANQSAWTAPLGATNRLLIGPFKTAKEAKDLVNELAKVQISSYSWTSEAGQAVTKISAK